MSRTRRSRASRRGLAPLELVLAIPLLMFVVGLSVVFGAVACWRVRAHGQARDAIWSHRWPRGEFWDHDLDRRPREWPLPATVDHNFEPPLMSLHHEAFDEPVIRGPLPGNIDVNEPLFDPTIGLRRGHSHIQRTPPALAALGDYHLDVEHYLFDGKWQFGQVGLGSNDSRRAPVLYPNLFDLPQTRPLKSQYQAAIAAVAGSPLKPDLAVLDRDAEIFAWYHFYRDFHPRFPQFCSLDTEQVRLNELPRQIERIDGTPPPGRRPRRPIGVPADLTRFFLSMYRQQLQVLQNSVPPGSPAEIAALEARIEILEDFLDHLGTL